VAALFFGVELERKQIHIDFAAKEEPPPPNFDPWGGGSLNEVGRLLYLKIDTADK
jgi:hypothetical protein